MAITAGLAVVAVVAGIDLAAGRHTVVIGLIVVAPVLTMVIGSSQATWPVGVVALGVGVLSGLWDHDIGTWTFLLRILAIAAGGGLAVVAGRAREHSELSAQRFDLLMRLALVGEAARSVGETAHALSEVLVPDYCDVCIVDVVRGGAPERLAVRASGARAAEVEAFLRRRGPEPVTAGVSVTAEVARSGAVLVDRVTDEVVQGWSRDAADLAELRALELSSTIVLPLRSGEHLAGVLTVSRTTAAGRRFDQGDLEFVKVLAGRVSLALDNAGLSQQLTEAERQMASSLESLVEAVVVQDLSGTVRFANGAALALAGSGNGSVARIETLLSRLDFADEHGKAVSLAELPGSRMLAGASAEPMLVRARTRDGAGEERWLLAKCSAVRDDRGQITGLVSIFEDVTTVQRVEQGRRLLAEATDALSASLDYEETLGHVTALATRSLADWCTVSLPDGASGLTRVAVAIADGDRADAIGAALERIPPGAFPDAGDANVLRDGQAQMVNGLAPEILAREVGDPTLGAALEELDLGAVIIVPLLTVGANLGVMTLCRTRARGPFAESELSLARELGQRAGTAVGNALLYTERTRIATMLQQALRPPQLRAPSSWSVASLYEPVGDASAAGGDFYDLFTVPGGHMAVIGDVTGHGPEAARLTSLARYTLRTAGELTADPLRAMRQLNTALRDGGELQLATALCLHIRHEPNGTAWARIVSAGHPLPLIVSDRGVTSAGTHGLIAGFAPEPEWTAVETELAPGDTLVLYTDGVTDARRGSERFGEERLLDCVAAAAGDPEALINSVRAALAAFRDCPAEDDVALLALRYDPTGPR